MKRLLLILFLFISTQAWAVVPAQTPLKNVYSCNSSTTQFPYSFPISATSDMTVYTVDANGNVTPQTNFTVDTTNVWVVYPATGPACPTGTQLVLLPATPKTQLLSLTNRSPFVPSAIGSAFDKLTIITQQLQEQLNRSILSPVNQNAGTGIQFPNPLANAFIGWDSTGTVLQNNVLQALTTSSSPTFAGLTLGSLGGILKATAGVVSTASADVDYSIPNGTETLTNKTYDTAGTGNVFKINGQAINAVNGNTGKVAQVSGSITSGNCVKVDASGNLVDFGSACNSSGSSLTGSISGTASQVTVTANSNSVGQNITLSLPQNINTAANVTFGGAHIGSLNGIIKGTIGVLGVATSGTDYAPATSGSSILKGNGSGGFSNAVSATDYAPATTGSSILKASSGGFANAVAGTDYSVATSGSGILSGNGAGGFSNITIGNGMTFSGGALSSTGFVPINMQVFTTSGTWTKPAGVSNVYVKVIGGGGNGGAASSHSSGGGGGGGGYAEGNIAVTGNVTVTIGATNSFAGSTTIQATSGSVGSNGVNGAGGAGGAGGVGSNGTINLTGATGSGGISQGGSGGFGGGSPFGSGGGGGQGANSASDSAGDGSNGGAYGGGGGGGGANASNGGDHPGGTGNVGAVIVYY